MKLKNAKLFLKENGKEMKQYWTQFANSNEEIMKFPYLYRTFIIELKNSSFRLSAPNPKRLVL